MSKIVIAANAMIEYKEKITNVIPGWNAAEVFFLYDNKYKWSVFKRSDGHYSLMYFPGNQSLSVLAGMEDQEWADFTQHVTYSSKDIGTRESLDTFQDLYNLVVNRKYGMEEVLDDIINSFDF